MNRDEDEPRAELEGMQSQVDSLGEQISDVREDWERKKADSKVPGADGDPLAAQSDHASENFPAIGDSDELGGDLPDAAEPLDPQDPANEDL